MGSSLEELLAKEGFKGRRLFARSRSSFRLEAASEKMPVSLSSHNQGRRASVSGDTRIKTERAKSDISRYSVRDELLKSDGASSSRPRDNLARREDIDSGVKRIYMLGNEIIEVGEEEDNPVKHVYSNEVCFSNSRKGKGKGSNEACGKSQCEDSWGKDKKVYKSNSSGSMMHSLGRLSDNKSKGIKESEKSCSRSKQATCNSKSVEDYCGQNHDRGAIQVASDLALDEVAVQAIVSILNGCIKRFLKDEDFRTTLHYKCFSSLDFIQLEEECNTETKIVISLEQAMETVEQAAEGSVSAKDLKKASLQLSVIAGLSLNDMKERLTCGVSNYKLSACAHLYLSVVYVMQKKERASAKHLLQVFCDSPFQARTTLLLELWEYLFAAHLSHLKEWYNQEVKAVADTPNRTRKLRLLEKAYNEMLDSGTYKFAMYYKDWLTEGVEAPKMPSIHIPSVSLWESHQGSSFGHSSELGSSTSTDPFSPKPMVSKKLYDAMFGSLHKSRLNDDDNYKEEEDSDSYLRSSGGSSIVKQTLTYSSEAVKYTDQDIEGGFTGNAPLAARYLEYETSLAAVEEWRLDTVGVQLERELNDENCISILWQETPSNTHMQDATSQTGKNNSLSDPTLSTSSHSSEASISNLHPIRIHSCLEGSSFTSIPQDFICPLTGKLFEEPVTLETGQTFEQAAIKAWFDQGNKTCPVTGITLERLSMPLTNLVLKRLVDNWKLQHCRRTQDFASQVVEKSKEHILEHEEESVPIILEQLLTAFSKEEKTKYSKHLISLGGVEFLVRRFELCQMEEKADVVASLLSCIEVDSDCRSLIARVINKQCLHELLHSTSVESRISVVSLLTELMCLKRREDVTSFLRGMQNEGLVHTMKILLEHLQSSPLPQRPLIAVLMLHFDMLDEPQMWSTHREVAIDAIISALDASLTDENVREKSCRALLVLGRHLSLPSKLLIETWINRAEHSYDALDVKSLDNEQGLPINDTIVLDVEVKRSGDWLGKSLLETLVGDRTMSFLCTISKCLDSTNSDLVRVSLVTTLWLSSALSSVSDVGICYTAFSALILRLKEILKNEGKVEFKVLACLSMLNLSRISDCKVLLLTMIEDIAVPLRNLVEVTWTAEWLLTLMSVANR